MSGAEVSRRKSQDFPEALEGALVLSPQPLPCPYAGGWSSSNKLYLISRSPRWVGHVIGRITSTTERAGVKQNINYTAEAGGSTTINRRAGAFHAREKAIYNKRWLRDLSLVLSSPSEMPSHASTSSSRSPLEDFSSPVVIGSMSNVACPLPLKFTDSVSYVG
ncbi:hypothetical protein EVAR_48867_1 [Eumeta japonica]|uniref:Uncharacterized protein n=1 Tax=Eumeta variegata TaxID=151549 RepID=A0A4C1Y7V7_EUMVA|nr:hypothetical protein EVAR_48867_1 [Eumeta japonica]